MEFCFYMSTTWKVKWQIMYKWILKKKGILNKREYLGPVWPADVWPANDIPFCSIFTYFQYSLIHDLAPSIVHEYVIPYYNIQQGFQKQLCKIPMWLPFRINNISPEKSDSQFQMLDLKIEDTPEKPKLSEFWKSTPNFLEFKNKASQFFFRDNLFIYRICNITAIWIF